MGESIGQIKIGTLIGENGTGYTYVVTDIVLTPRDPAHGDVNPIIHVCLRPTAETLEFAPKAKGKDVVYRDLCVGMLRTDYVME